jgi:hypothetical protein
MRLCDAAVDRPRCPSRRIHAPKADTLPDHGREKRLERICERFGVGRRRGSNER